MTITAVLSERETSSAQPDIDIGTCLAAASGVSQTYARYRAAYADLFGHTRYDRVTHALTVRAHRVRAVMVSQQHGVAVHEALGSRQLPIFGSGDSVSVFLTAGPAPDDDVLRLEWDLYGAHAVLVGAGAELALPTPGNDRRAWLWGLPMSHELPSYREVVTAVAGARRG